MGFTQFENDQCIYYRNTGGEMFYTGVYVNDNNWKNGKKLTEVKIGLPRKFNTKDLASE